jgi:hypothetical protein
VGAAGAHHVDSAREAGLAVSRGRPDRTAHFGGTDPQPTSGRRPARRGQVLSVRGAILALLAVVAVALIILRIARAVEGRTTGGGIDDVVTAPAVDVDALQDVLRRAHEQILLDDDANRAVVRCWESVEALGARGGVTRGPSETAAEYVIGILSALDAPAPPAVRLSRLYQRALFSAERLPPDAVALALADLAELDAALARPSVAGRSADAGSVVDS